MTGPRPTKGHGMNRLPLAAALALPAALEQGIEAR